MRILLVCAHADDETIGASTLLGSNEVRLLYATDSAPGNLAFAHRAGFDTRFAYSQARQEELRRALALVGSPSVEVCDIPDQQSVRHLDFLVDRIRQIARDFQPARIYTHPYEGGHPDHDALALAASLCGLPDIWEFTGYHASPAGQWESGVFLGLPEGEAVTLTPAELARKQAMFECFASQREILSRFALSPERFRPAPVYDFSQPPHPGPLYYETRDLGWTYDTWRAETQSAIGRLS